MAGNEIPLRLPYITAASQISTVRLSIDKGFKALGSASVISGRQEVAFV
jgi:hypothetical protein